MELSWQIILRASGTEYFPSVGYLGRLSNREEGQFEGI